MLIETTTILKFDCSNNFYCNSAPLREKFHAEARLFAEVTWIFDKATKQNFINTLNRNLNYFLPITANRRPVSRKVFSRRNTKKTESVRSIVQNGAILNLFRRHSNAQKLILVCQM